MSDQSDQPQNLSAIDFLRTRSLANVVQAEIERMIIDGELKPNERVNENALSQRLGVSRGPIREACSALSAIGLIETIPNRGFFIRALSNDEALDFQKPKRQQPEAVGDAELNHRRERHRGEAHGPLPVLRGEDQVILQERERHDQWQKNQRAGNQPRRDEK